MAVISKDEIDLDTTMINLKFVLRGRKEILNVYCTATQSTEFVDFLNQNRFKKLNKEESEMFDNRFYIFDDIKNKKHVMVSLKDVKYFEIPFLIDNGEEYELKILSWK